MKSGGKVLIQVLIVSSIGLAGVVGVWLLLPQGASASPMLQGELDHIVICTDDAGQTPAGDHTMTTDDT